MRQTISIFQLFFGQNGGFSSGGDGSDGGIVTISGGLTTVVACVFILVALFNGDAQEDEVVYLSGFDFHDVRWS